MTGAPARARPRAAALCPVDGQSRGARRAPAVPAPARRAPRTGPAAVSPSRRPRETSRSRSIGRRAAPLSAVCSPSTLRTAPSAFSTAADLLAEWGQELPLVVVTNDEQNVARSFRNLDRVVVVKPGELEVAALVWARSVLVTEDALDLVKAKAS